MFTNERLFTIQAFTITRVQCTWPNATSRHYVQEHHLFARVPYFRYKFWNWYSSNALKIKHLYRSFQTAKFCEAFKSMTVSKHKIGLQRQWQIEQFGFWLFKVYHPKLDGILGPKRTHLNEFSVFVKLRGHQNLSTILQNKVF